MHLHLRDYLGKVSIIFPGDNIPEGMVSQITVNNYDGTRITTRYLISLGHRELVFLGGRDSSVIHRRQHQGFLDAATIREKVNRYWYSVHQRSFCLGRHAGGGGKKVSCHRSKNSQRHCGYYEATATEYQQSQQVQKTYKNRIKYWRTAPFQ